MNEPVGVCVGEHATRPGSPTSPCRLGEIEEGTRETVFAELRRSFRPEFLNRIDDTVLFKPRRIEEIEKIVDLLSQRLRQRLAAQNLEPAPDARELIAGSIPEGSTIRIGGEDGEPVVGHETVAAVS